MQEDIGTYAVKCRLYKYWCYLHHISLLDFTLTDHKLAVL